MLKNIFQNEEIKEKCGNAIYQSGFNETDDLVKLNQFVRIFGMNLTFHAIILYGSNSVISNG
jgi:hypothetical protein